MEAGRELDAKVHEALGVKWDESRCRICGWPIKPSLDEGCTKNTCSMVYEGGKPPRADEPPAYSTTYEGMGLVLERMEQLKWSYEIHHNRLLKEKHVAKFMKLDDIHAKVYAQAKDIRHAVSLAALEACKHGH